MGENPVSGGTPAIKRRAIERGKIEQLPAFVCGYETVFRCDKSIDGEVALRKAMPYSINKFLLFVVLGVDHLEDLLRRCGISAILESASLLKTYSSEYS